MTISPLESTSHFVNTYKYIKMNLQIFDPIACVNTAADSANGSCQL